MHISYWVYDEHTLGYIDDRQPGVFGILRASILRGSTFNPLDGFTILPPNPKLRPATLADFEAFRVLPPSSHLEALTGSAR